MRARILAGQIELRGNPLGWQDWKWVTRSEAQEMMKPRVFAAVRDALVGR